MFHFRSRNAIRRAYHKVQSNPEALFYVNSATKICLRSLTFQFVQPCPQLHLHTELHDTSMPNVGTSNRFLILTTHTSSRKEKHNASTLPCPLLNVNYSVLQVYILIAKYK
jgi:hypothetical protein